jgi:Secreted repeat of unknown function
MVTRPDGAEQITLDELPLYTFTDDRQPGMVLGDGLADELQGTRFVWHVVRAGEAPAAAPAMTAAVSVTDRLRRAAGW